MAASVSRVMTTIAAALLLGGVLSACSDDPPDDSIVVGGFVASPLGSWYADSDQDTLASLEGLAFSPLSVHVRRNYAADARGVSSPEDDSAYIESIVKTSTGKIVVSYVLEGERASIDFDTSEVASYDSIFGETTQDGHRYAVQLYTDLGTADAPASRDYVATARWYTFEQRPGVSPYDGIVYEFFGTYGVRTPSEPLSALGSASYEGNILGNIWDTGNPNRRTGSELLAGSLSLSADLDNGEIGGQVTDFTRFDRDATDLGRQPLADTNVIEITGSIMDGRFTADWEGHDNGGTPAEGSVRGYSGAMLGEFYGPAGEEVGGVLRGHRDATTTTPEQIFNGFFSAGKEPKAGQ